MRRITSILALTSAALLSVGLPASAAWAADATGCSGSVQSMMADGTALDSASAPGEGGTQNDPLVIDPQGTVQWQGSTDAPITSGTWSVSVMGLPFLSGEVDNADGTTSGSGTVDLGTAPAPVQWVFQTKAKIPVSGSMSGQGGTCSGSGYIAGSGSSPLTSPIFIAGASLAVIGILLGLWMVLGTKATAVAATAATTTGGAA